MHYAAGHAVGLDIYKIFFILCPQEGMGSDVIHVQNSPKSIFPLPRHKIGTCLSVIIPRQANQPSLMFIWIEL